MLKKNRVIANSFLYLFICIFLWDAKVLTMIVQRNMWILIVKQH